MAARPSRLITIAEKIQLTPNMIRIVLGGDSLNDFPEGQESGYVKLVFQKNGKTVVRSYTIRAFNPITKQLTLDFVVHGDNGPASAWAISAKVGDSITINGPGPIKLMNHNADWFLIAGDMTALPAMAVNLEKLPAKASGYAVIEVLSEADCQDLKTPDNMHVNWLINPHPDQPNTVLTDAVRALPWQEGTPDIWVATEFETMRNLRRYFKLEREVTRDELYISSYWKMGDTDEGNKAAKKIDPEADI